MFQSLRARPGTAASMPATAPAVASGAPMGCGRPFEAANRFGHHLGTYSLGGAARAPIQRAGGSGAQDGDQEKEKQEPQKNQEPLRKFVNLNFPSRPVDRDIKPRKLIRQPLNVMVPKKVEKHKLPGIEDFQESLNRVEMTLPSGPKKRTIKNLKQHKGVPIKNLGLELGGANQQGLRPKDEKYITELPHSIDYTGNRSGQVMSQLSEVFLHLAEKDDKKPVEVQFGYGEKEDKSLDLFASANNKDSQEWIHKALNDPIGTLKKGALSKDEEIRRVSLKLLFSSTQNRRRRELIKEHPNKKEFEEDLKRSESILDRFWNGPVTVVQNEHDRHAEQNIGDVLTDERHGYESGDIQGAKIRCEGCSSELGMNLQNSSGQFVIGTSYATQSSKEKHQHTFDEIREGRTKVATNRSKRPRSPSPVWFQPRKEKKENPVEPKKNVKKKKKKIQVRSRKNK